MSLPAKTPAQPLLDEKRSFGQGGLDKCRGCGALHASEVLSAAFEPCRDWGHHHPLPVGSAGPPVIENTIKAQPPAGFRRPSFLLEHGMIDIVSPRAEMRETLCSLLQHLSGGPS